MFILYHLGKGVGWAWTPNGHYPIGRRGVVVQTSPYHTQPCTPSGRIALPLRTTLGMLPCITTGQLIRRYTMTNELLRTSSLSFFVSISYHTSRVLSSVLDNFFEKNFRSVFIHQLCIIMDTHQVRQLAIFLPGSSFVGFCVSY